MFTFLSLVVAFADKHQVGCVNVSRVFVTVLLCLRLDGTKDRLKTLRQDR